MEALFHFIAYFIAVTLDVISFAMLARMLVSMLFDGEDSRLAIFLVCITEPFIIPIRYLMAKFNILQNSPIDWSFTVSYLVIIIIGSVLPAV